MRRTREIFAIWGLFGEPFGSILGVFLVAKFGRNFVRIFGVKKGKKLERAAAGGGHRRPA